MYVKAFSLIELMVVVSIVAVLAAVAVPAYKDHVLKSRLTSAFNAAGKLMKEIDVYYFTKGAMPTRMSQLSHTEGGGTLNSGQIFSTSDFNGGVVVETGFWGAGGCNGQPGIACAWIGVDKNAFGLATDGVLAFNATVGSDGGLSWRCHTYSVGGWTSMPTKYLPSFCT